MFDVVGVARTDQGPLPRPCALDAAFAAEPWTSHPGVVRRSVAAPGCRALCLGRDGDAEDYATSLDCHLFLIGEAFARLGPAGPAPGPGRMSATAALAMYLERGTGLLEAIKGNFTIVILDRRARTAYVLSSHFAVSPLYYACADGAVYFSTSLAELGRALPRRPEVDLAAVVETMVLNWPMHERTFLRDVRRIALGTIVTVRADVVSRRAYWDQRPLYRSTLLSAAEALERGSGLFHRCANDLVADQPKVCASFTSGFDSRALHAVLDKDRSQILAYSFGPHGRVNVSIPRTICTELGYPFTPFYLDGRFEEVFDEYACQTVRLSDGLVVQRANYPYVFQQLSAFAPVVVTGIFGSEFLRTFQNLGDFVSDNFARINGAEDPVCELRRVIAEHRSSSYLLS